MIFTLASPPLAYSHPLLPQSRRRSCPPQVQDVQREREKEGRSEEDGEGEGGVVKVTVRQLMGRRSAHEARHGEPRATYQKPWNPPGEHLSPHPMAYTPTANQITPAPASHHVTFFNQLRASLHRPSSATAERMPLR